MADLSINTLQEYCTKNSLPTPKYETVSNSVDVDNNHTFTVRATIGKHQYVATETGRVSNAKKAAAKGMYLLLIQETDAIADKVDVDFISKTLTELALHLPSDHKLTWNRPGSNIDFGKRIDSQPAETSSIQTSNLIHQTNSLLTFNGAVDI